MRVRKLNRVDHIVWAATNGAHWEAMSSWTVTIAEDNILNHYRLERLMHFQGYGIKRTVPELMATQSSWLYTVAPVMVIWSLSPISNASVLWPRLPASPARPSMVAPLIVSPEEPEILKHCSGVFRIFKPVICEEPVRPWAKKNFGLVVPPLLPFPSHQRCPWPSSTWPEAPETWMFWPDTEIRGPAHCWKPKVVFPSKMTYEYISH